VAALASPAAAARAQDAAFASLATTATLPAIVALRGSLSATSLVRGEALTASLVLENPSDAPIRELVTWLDAGEARSLRWSQLSGPSELAAHTTAAAAFRVEATSEAWPETVDLHAACHGSLQAADGTTQAAEGFLPDLATLHVHISNPDDDHPDEFAGTREGPDSLPQGVETTGILEIGGDWDVYSFAAAHPGTYLFEVQSSWETQATLDVLAWDGQSVLVSASPDAPGVWKTARVELTAARAWPVRVRGESAWRRGRYVVRANAASDSVWSRGAGPPAASRAGEAPVELTTRTLDLDGTTVAGVLASIGEELSWAVVPPRGGWYRFDLGRDPQGRLMPCMEVRDWTWRKLAESDPAGGGRQTLSLPLARGGPYVVRVSRPTDQGEYGFELSARRQRLRLGQRPGVLVVREGQPEPLTLPLTNLGGPLDEIAFGFSATPPGLAIDPGESPRELAAGATTLVTFVVSAGGAPIGTSAEVALTCRARDAGTLAPQVEDRARVALLVVQPANPRDDHADASDRVMLPRDTLVLDGPSVPGALETSGDRDVVVFRTEDVGPHELQALPPLGTWTFLILSPIPEGAGPVQWSYNWFTPSFMTAEIAVPGTYGLTVLRLLDEGARVYALSGRACRLQASIQTLLERLHPYRPTPGTLSLKNRSLGFHDVRATLSLAGAQTVSATCQAEFGRLLPEASVTRDFQFPAVGTEHGADMQLLATVEGRRKPGGALLVLGRTELGSVFLPVSTETDDHANAVTTIQDPRDRIPVDGNEVVASIEAGGDRDVFFFDVPEPGWCLIECTPVAPAFDPILERLDSEDRVLDENRGARSFREAARLTFEALQPGRHRIGIRLRGTHQTGDYRLRVSREWLALEGPLQITTVLRGASASVTWQVTNRGAALLGVSGSLVVTPAEDVRVTPLQTPFELAQGQTGRLRFRFAAASEARFGSRRYTLHATATASRTGEPVRASLAHAGLLVVSEEPPISPADDRPADPAELSPADARPQTDGTPVQGQGDFFGDEDAFSFVAPAAGLYRFEAGRPPFWSGRVTSLTVIDTDGKTELATWSAAFSDAVTGELHLSHPGTYHCRVVSEGLSTCYQLSIRQAALPPVDLTADAVSSSSTRLAVGQQVRLEGRVRNLGGLWAPPARCSWVMTPVSTPTLAIACFEQWSQGLAPGGTAALSVDTYNFNPPVGRYRVGFRVETPEGTEEPNQANNTAIATEPLEILALPELQARGLHEPPARLVAGGRYDLTGVVEQHGSRWLTKPVECDLYLAPASGWPVANAVLLGSAVPQWFSETAFVSWQVRIPDELPAGPWHLTQVVDPLGRIRETVETNNVRSHAVSLEVVEADSLEPNDTQASAAPLQPGTRTLSLVDGDVDWLGFEAERGDLIRLELAPVEPVASFGWDVRDPSGRVRIAERHASGAARRPLTFQVSSRGTHLLRVAGSPGLYSLVFRHAAAADSRLNLSALTVRVVRGLYEGEYFAADIRFSSEAVSPERLRPPIRVFLSGSPDRSAQDGVDMSPPWDTSWTLDQLPGQQQLWGIPWASLPITGPQYVHVVVDPDNEFEETDETDNWAATATPFDLPWPAIPQDSAPVLVSPTVLDFGDMPAGGIRCRRLSFSRAGPGNLAPTLGVLPPELGSSWQGMSPGQLETCTAEFTLQAATRPGPYRTSLSVVSGSPASVTVVPVVANVVECADPPPVAWAGEDLFLNLERRGERQDRPLTGATASDPDLTPVAVDWRIAWSGSPGAVLANAASLTPTLVVTQPGLVIAELTARSGFPPLAASDRVLVTVIDPADPFAGAATGQPAFTGPSGGGGCRLQRQAQAAGVSVGDLALLALPFLLVRLHRRRRGPRPLLPGAQWRRLALRNCRATRRFSRVVDQPGLPPGTQTKDVGEVERRGEGGGRVVEVEVDPRLPHKPSPPLQHLPASPSVSSSEIVAPCEEDRE
jgi:hypothetical protein